MANICFIDDCAEQADLAAMVLKRFGHRTTYHPETTTDLILLDEYLDTSAMWNAVRCGDESGLLKARLEMSLSYLKTLKYIHQLRQGGYSNIICVMVGAGLATPEELSHFYIKAGADYVINKPLNLTKFAAEELPLLLTRKLTMH